MNREPELPLRLKPIRWVHEMGKDTIVDHFIDQGDATFAWSYHGTDETETCPLCNLQEVQP